MKLSKVLKKIVLEDGKHSSTARKVNKLKKSKEFLYLVDTDRA